MATTEDIDLNGVEPVGRHEPHYGDEKAVYDEITLGQYDQSEGDNGNVYDIRNVYGFSRLLFVELQVLGNSGYLARYDYEEHSVRVFAQSNDGEGTPEDELVEVSQGEQLDIDIRVRAVGTGT